MNKKEFLEELNKNYPVSVHTEYHMTIPAGSGKHNIWLTNIGVIKFKPAGSSKVSVYSDFKAVLNKLKTYVFANTDLAHMRSLSSLLKEIEGKTGIFVDAGWKEGKAKISVVKAHANGDLDITVRCITAKNNVEAERRAIFKASTMYPGDEPIYTDCKTAVSAKHPRAVWVPRKQNKDADRFGNMRA